MKNQTVIGNNTFKLIIIPILFIFQISFCQNIIQNGDFESGNDNWILINSDVGASVTIDNTISFQNNNSIKLQINNGSSEIISGIYQSLNILPNTTYIFSYAIKTDSVDLFCFPYFKFNNGTDFLIAKSFVSSRTKDWTVYNMRITTPDNVNKLDFFVFLTGNMGTVWIDTINFSEISTINTLNFTVNFNTVIDTFNTKLLSTNSSPITPTSPNNLTTKFQEIGIKEVRTHDIYGSCDIHLIFPDFSADPLNPNSYDFSTTDSVILSIINSGAKPFYRLGETYDGTPNLFNPPTDFDKWATICLQIVKHYNNGWDNGFYYNIEKWEIWNEPDLNNYWTGTPQQFYDLYKKTALKLKNYDPNIKIGAASFASINNTTFLDSFLDSISNNNTPLDFISYHSYNFANPYYYTIQQDYLQSLLSNFGLANIETYLTEWNNYEYNTETTITEYGRDDALSASLTASSFYYLQNSTLTGAFRYRTDEYLFGLFRANGDYSYSGLAFKTIGSFNINNQLLQVNGNDTLGAVCIAGKSNANDKFSVIVSNPNKPSNGYIFNINNLTDSYNYKIYRIDNNNELVVIENGVVSPTSNTIISNASPPFVDYITFNNTQLGVNSLNFSEEKIILYPNPTKGKFFIKTNLNYKKIDFKLFSNIGKEVIKINNQKDMDISNLPKGIYFLQIGLDERIKIKKIIKE